MSSILTSASSLSNSLSNPSSTKTPKSGKRVAVIGSGCSGLAAAWALNEYSPHEVHLYEHDDWWGGHAHTVNFDGQPVDTGFIVLNPITYPSFLAFLRHQEIELIETSMSFSISRDKGAFEWAGTTLGGLFCQIKNLWNPAMWRMLFDMLRFNTLALDLLNDENDKLTLQQYLDVNHFSEPFRMNYLIPMISAVWSTPPDVTNLTMPATAVVRFMHNHHFLQMLNRPKWMTVKNGSINYVNSIINKIPEEQLHLKTTVGKLSRNRKGKIQINNGKEGNFDYVIFCGHADQTLRLLQANPKFLSTLDSETVPILSKFKFNHNIAVLHKDTDNSVLELMPKRRSAWTSWNYMTRSGGKEVSVSYWMNSLQSIDEKKHGAIMVSLNPLNQPRKELTYAEWKYSHPQYTVASVKAQKRLVEIQDVNDVAFAGAWTKFGFHEDGFSSGLNVAVTFLDARLPFMHIQDAKHIRGHAVYLRKRDIIWRKPSSTKKE